MNFAICKLNARDILVQRYYVPSFIVRLGIFSKGEDFLKPSRLKKGDSDEVCKKGETGSSSLPGFGLECRTPTCESFLWLW